MATSGSSARASKDRISHNSAVFMADHIDRLSSSESEDAAFLSYFDSESDDSANKPSRPTVVVAAKLL